ncbi:MAG: pyridoxal-dependent decarboxylase, partial [Actinomycetota bacterium]|nr:pyridoxal-dependent decarboxylase [Actinomycetota bacterium]
MNPEEFRTAAHELVDWIADYRLRAEGGGFPVRSRLAPGDVAALLPDRLPEDTTTISGLVADLERIVVPGLTHTQHPSNFAWFPANASLASVLGDF